MPLASDFVVIQSAASSALPVAAPAAPIDAPASASRSAEESDEPGAAVHTAPCTAARIIWQREFDIGRRQPRGHAVVMLMIKGLTQPQTDLNVLVNGQPVGALYTYRDANPRHWFAQIVNIDGSVLVPGENTLALCAIHPSTALAAFDAVAVRDVVCFFQGR